MTGPCSHPVRLTDGNSARDTCALCGQLVSEHSTAPATFVSREALELYQFKGMGLTVATDFGTRDLTCHSCFILSTWLPTSANINSLPPPLRDYIHQLETLCDPSGMIRENALARGTIRGLELMLIEERKK